MLERLDLRGLGGDVAGHLPRPPGLSDGALGAVRSILAQVRARGDTAVRELTASFDRVTIDDLAVPPGELDAALAEIPARLREALQVASAAVTDYHRHQLEPQATYQRDGVEVKTLRRPVGRAGLYVPGGRARYPSSVLMTAIPARVAGVSEIALCVPPDRNGAVNAPTLAAARLAGVGEVYRIGGAQAVAAMAYGTESLPAVDVIAGPGNVYVSLAMREVAGIVGVPSAFAGPSEVVVVADASTPADLAAIDVVVQAEHGPGGLAWLVTWEPKVADAVDEAVRSIVARAPRRSEIEATLVGGGYAVVVDGPEQAMSVANAVAPEHLQLMTLDADSLLPLVSNAGAVFVGTDVPASIGDYLAGPSHVLPTSRSARFASALGVGDFTKDIHVVSLEPATLGRLAGDVAAIAEAEGLSAHAASVRMRGGSR